MGKAAQAMHALCVICAGRCLHLLCCKQRGALGRLGSSQRRATHLLRYGAIAAVTQFSLRFASKTHENNGMRVSF
jgi:hypothetical protein